MQLRISEAQRFFFCLCSFSIYPRELDHYISEAHRIGNRIHLLQLERQSSRTQPK
jgi:hypothetical protein